MDLKLILFVVVVSIVVFSFGIIFHELGHLFFGLLSGYEFNHFLIYGIGIKKENGKFHIFRQKVPGVLGQCLISPKDYTSNWSYKLMFFGGVIFNVLLASIALAALIFFDLQENLRIVFIMSAVANFGLAIAMGIPQMNSGFPNDAHFVYTASKSKDARKSLYLSLKITNYLEKYKTIGNMPKPLIELDGDADYSNYLVASTQITICEWEFEHDNYNDGIKIINQLVSYLDKYPMLVRIGFVDQILNFIIKYNIELESITQIESLFSKEIKRHKRKYQNIETSISNILDLIYRKRESHTIFEELRIIENNILEMTDEKKVIYSDKVNLLKEYVKSKSYKIDLV